MSDNVKEEVKVKEKSYDGIQEFDNPLPRWWLYTFYFTIVFGFGYWIFYQTLHLGGTQEELLAVQNADREQQQLKNASNVTEVILVTSSKDPMVVARGAAVFAQNCVACHGIKGQGGIGPNLTDNYFIHGSKAMDMYNIVSAGVADKGMPSWKPVLGPVKIQEVVAFLLTIKNTNVPGGKSPEGELAKD